MGVRFNIEYFSFKLGKIYQGNQIGEQLTNVGAKATGLFLELIKWKYY